MRSVYEVEILRPTGEQRTLAVNASPWIDKNGAFTGSFVIANDITEQKQIAINEKRSRAHGGGFTRYRSRAKQYAGHG